MSILNIRELLSRYHIQWIDKGPNCSKGNINITCPFCGLQDRSHHLAISETGLGYYCFRNPKHSGKSLSYLLRALKIPIGDYLDSKATPLLPPKKERKDYSEFNYFLPAAESQEALDYLSSRLFSSPLDICKRFNLHTSPNGRWAGRLIIPLTIGWTARAIRSHIQPRYLSHTDETALLITGKGSTAFIVEGPLDAIRLASVALNYTVISTLGQKIPASLLMYLRDRKFLTIKFLPDSDVPEAQCQQHLSILRTYCTNAEVKRVKLAPNFKDLCELTENGVREWLWNDKKPLKIGLDRGNLGQKRTVIEICGE